MPASKYTHVLAILRRNLRLKQSDLAAMVGCSTVTIQSVEVNRLKLSKSLAARISLQTGADLDWLLANDVSVPMPKHHAGQQGKYELVSFTMEVELEEPMDRAAALRGMNRSQYVCWLVQRDLAAHLRKPLVQKAETDPGPVNVRPARREKMPSKHPKTESPKPRKARSRTPQSA